ncbi:MAG: TonB-dependent receptor [Niabella sp.]
MQTLLEKTIRAFVGPRSWLTRPYQLVLVISTTTLLLFSGSIDAQERKISGHITNESGEAVASASVQVKGTDAGTIANTEGYFVITAAGNATLVFSSAGYKEQEVQVDNRSVINITLLRSGGEENAIVVIGYGNQRKEAVTGSVASVSGATLQEVPSANISQALQGRVAGVQMTQTSTKPGATMQIRIRGTRSINADNDPLIVLDGIPFSGTIADISPDDIKSIDILKDASATAIYGSRGANGVILVTTNKGAKRQDAQVLYHAYVGAKKAIRYPMMEAKEYIALRNRAGLNAVPGADEDTTGAVNTDWQDLFYKTGIVQNHDVSVVGGSEKGNYRFGVGYYKDEAVIPESDYSRISIRGSLDQQIGKLFSIGFTTNNNYNITNGANLGMYGVLSMSPIADPFNEDGSTKRTVLMAQDEQWVYTRGTMSSLGDKYIDRTKAFGSYNSLYGEMKIPGITGLKARINLGGNYRSSNYGNYTGIGVFSSNEDNPNSATIANAQTTQWTIENILTYDRTFAQKHKINAVALYSAEQTSYNSSSISRTNIAGDNFQYFNLGQTSTSDNDDITISPGSQGYTVSGLMSYMARAMYSYKDLYMLSATFRSDASSRLAAGHKWHTYPAVSAGWNIGKESFMEPVSWVDALKLRIGYGQTSNQSISPYSTLGKLSTIAYNFGSEYATGYYVSTLPNEDLGWEYSITKNLGLDFSLLKNRLSGTFEYYVTNTKDLLLSVNLPTTSGVSSYTGNVGATQNKGWELSLNGTILDNKNGWNWDLGVNIYQNKNKIVRLASGQTTDESNWLFVGHPLNVIYDYKRIGIWQTSEADVIQNYEGSSGKVGMIKVLYTGDYNEDGTPTRVIGSADRQILDADPDWQGGWNTRVGYKAFDLTVVGTFQKGGILNSTLYGSSSYLNLEDGRRGQIKIDYWTEDNTDAKYPDPNGPKNSNNPKYASTLGYFDGSYMKIRTITLGYNLDKSWMKNIGIQRFRFYFTAQNPFVFFSPYHKESGLDPETNSYANDSSTAAVAYNSTVSRLLTVGYSTPVTRNYILGINVTF